MMFLVSVVFKYEAQNSANIFTNELNYLLRQENYLVGHGVIIVGVCRYKG